MSSKKIGFSDIGCFSCTRYVFCKDKIVLACSLGHDCNVVIQRGRCYDYQSVFSVDKVVKEG